jgi:hypothetical protein
LRLCAVAYGRMNGLRMRAVNKMRSAVGAVIAMMRDKDEVIECGCAWRSAAAGGLRRNAVIP